MKKFFALALALVMTFALSVTCFAALESPKTGDVMATYKAPDAAGVVYKVDVEFGAMTFTYTPEGNGVWDPENHQYKDKAEAKWEASENTVTVTNHSNADVKVEITYKSETGFDTVIGSVDNPSFTLTSAAANNKATTNTAALTLSGTLAETATTATKVGTLTVALQ